MKKLVLHGIIEKENGIYSAFCLELDVASQGKTITEAKKNLQEAVELYLEEVISDKEEKHFIPRPAPREEWIKFFKAETEVLAKQLKAPSLKNRLKFEDVVYSQNSHYAFQQRN